MAVSGGTTPALYFDALAASRFKWDRIHLFFVDERAVPPDHADSNFRLAEEHLIKKARMISRQVHRIHGEMEPHEAADEYVEDIREFFNLKPGQAPHFDIVHQGMGPAIGETLGEASSPRLRRRHHRDHSLPLGGEERHVLPGRLPRNLCAASRLPRHYRAAAIVARTAATIWRSAAGIEPSSARMVLVRPSAVIRTV